MAALTEQDMLAIIAALQQRGLGQYPDVPRNILQPIISQGGIENMPDEQKRALGLLPPSTTPIAATGVAPSGPGGRSATQPAGIGSEPSAGGGGAGENPYAGGGFLSAGYPAEYGPLPEDIAKYFGYAGMIPYLGTPAALIWGMSELAKLAGAERGRTTLADLSPQAANVLTSQVRAYQGDYAARDLEAAIADARSQQMNREPWSPSMEPEAPSAGTPPSVGPEYTPAMEQPGAVTSPPPDYALQDALAELAGMAGDGGYTGSVESGTAYSGTTEPSSWGGGGDYGGGGGGWGEGGGYRKGGVSRATRGPKRAVFGEAGPETGVFVPESMKRPGIQGRERQVVQALRALLQALQPRKPKEA